LSPLDTALPGDVRAFLREADRRIERFTRYRHCPGFVPCDFVRAYGLLRALSESTLATGSLFCEWGSGFGVVACLAAMLDFESHGIEIQGELVDEAQQLARDFELPVEFLHASFIPEGSEKCLARDEPFAWLTTEASAALDEVSLDPGAFDVIFAYPWPDEEHVIPALFEQHAGVGALLLTYHGLEDLRVRRKVAQAPRRRARRAARP
jgi:hypothetical protein